MSLLSLCDVSFAYSCGPEVFASASFSVNPSDRIAVVGPNGAGKSTLLRLIAGQLNPASGQVIRRRPLVTTAADQGLLYDTALTLFDFVFSALYPLAQLRTAMRTLERQLSDAQSACEYSNCINEYEARRGYLGEAAVARILSGLGYDAEDFERDVRTLSGGERSRAALARALSTASDLLILDEPTSHLDVAAREWLETYLQSRNTACVLSSHDRTLLTKFATRIIDIERAKVTVFEGGYLEYRKAKELRDRQAWEAYDAFERRRAAVERAAERREQLARDVAIAPEGARGSKDFYRRKAAKVARTARILRERVSEERHVSKPWEERPIDGLSFERVPRSGDVVLSAQALTKTYGQKILFRKLSFIVRRGERLVIRGSNGSVKTTLLNIIQGKEQPDSGSVRIGEKARLAGLDQVPEGMELERSPLQVCGSETQARTLLACLKLPADRLNRPLIELSGGERTKVALARLLNSGANLLLLDEPTNHLEIEAQEPLEQALQRYPGTLIIVSHDRSFIQAIGEDATYLDLDQPLRLELNGLDQAR